MNRFIITTLSLVICFSSCKDAEKKIEGDHNHSGHAPKTLVDSLMAEVMDGHNIGMSKMSKLRAKQNEALNQLDSIALLPAKVQKGLSSYKIKLNGLMGELKSAQDLMDKWMEEFNMDSAKNEATLQIKYLQKEREKVNFVRKNILESLEKADSLLLKK
jgi:hypothetical protein